MYPRLSMRDILRKGCSIYWVMLAVLLIACQPDAYKGVIERPVDAPTVAEVTPLLMLTDIPTLKATAPSPQPSPTFPPSSPTPQKIVSVAAPDRWTEVLAAALSRLNAQDGVWNWRQVTNEADISLEAGDRGQQFASNRIALTVDFSSALESITLAEASEIISSGDERVSVMEWQEVSPERKTLRIDGLMPDDPDYALTQAWSAVFTPGYEEAAKELTAALKQEFRGDDTVKLSAVGDVMLDRALGYAILQGQIEYPFAQVADVLSQADFTIGNLESALGVSGEPANKSYTFQAPAAAVDSLKSAGFDLVSLANNHAMDFGEASLSEGIELLNGQGIFTIGAGMNSAMAHTPVVLEINGLRLAFLGYVNVPIEATGFDTGSWEATDSSPGLAWARPDDIIQDVASAEKDADLVIVVLHSGYEYVEAPSEPQQLAAKAAIDAGADLVIGHHAHVLQGIEFYNDGVIAYGLGNFAFEIDGDPATTVLNVWLDKDGVRELELIPAIIQFGGQTRLASQGEAASIKEHIYYLSALLNNS